MIRLLIIFIILTTSLIAFKIEAVEDEHINDNKATYIKDGRVVFNPIKNSVIKPIDNIVIKQMDIKVLKPMKNKVLQPYIFSFEKKKNI